MPEHNKNKNFAIVIPAYNEEATIKDIAERALAQCNNVIVVDDGSSDNTIEKLDDLAITLRKHDINKGKAASLWDGFTCAMKLDIDFIITLDGDAQHAPEDIPLLIAEGHAHPNNIIIGARLANKNDIPAKRYYANKIANFWIAWAAGYPLSDSQSGFRLYPINLFKQLDISISKNNSFVFESEIIIKAAQQGIMSKPVAIPAVYSETARPSHFRGVRDISLITLMVAKSLIGRGMYPQGLFRSTLKPLLLPSYDMKTDIDGYLMFILSFIIIIATAGLSLILAWVYSLSFARRKLTDSSEFDILLVLGKCLIEDQPDDDFKLRLNRAALILTQNNTSRVFILGGKTRSANTSESSAGKEYLIQKGIEENKIFIEENSRNTLENLKHFYALSDIKDQKVLLITNRYHLARSLLMAKGFGISTQACPAEDRYEYSLRNIIMTFIESFHLHWYIIGKYWAKLTNNKRMLERISILTSK